MSDDYPDVLHVSYQLDGRHAPDTDPEMTEMVKGRMARLLSDKLAEHLLNAPGGAIYSPVTWTIREDDLVPDMWAVHGSVNVLRFPDPATGEVRLVGGPMDGAIIKIGDPAPHIVRLPVVRSGVFDVGNEPTIVDYERVPGSQAYRWRG